MNADASGILTPTATRALLLELGIAPKRQLGQNFLVDGNIVRKSIELAQIAPGERVVEVGPGLGTLTAALLESGADVYAIERDRALVQHLAARLVTVNAARLHLREGDAVEQPLGPLPTAEAANAPFKVVANLPYAISSPWMEGVLAGPLPERMVLMLQLEAAQRYGAQPGTKSFGAISVFLQAAYRIAAGHRVSRNCFFPRPEVDSLLLHLERLPAPVSFTPETRAVIRAVFRQRRKQLAPLIRREAPTVAERWLASLATHGVRADARAEDVPVAMWIELDRCMRALT